MLSTREVQVEVFKAQLFNAVKSPEVKPLFVHLREPDTPTDDSPSAIEDLADILKEFVGSNDIFSFENIIVHCFTSNEVNMKRILKYKMKLGFTGFIGNKKRAEGTGTLSGIRSVKEDDSFLSNVMIETDAPYMKPDKAFFDDKIFKIMKKNRKGCNEPATLPITCQVLAAALDKSIDEVAKVTTDNAINFFGLNEADKRIRAFKLQK